ncbi:MAG TPA: type II CAAX endopeptidase family protein [Chloroflexota bacterium]|nr:type II CAAX endopeptidase family protein [Chloroflexota bacterium]
MQPRFALVGALLFVGLAISAWVFAPALRGPEAARRDVGTYRLSLGLVVALLALNFVLTLPLATAVGEDQPLSIATFAWAALATQIPILLVVYARLVRPRAVTWRELGLRPLPLQRILSVGVTVGLLGLMLTVTVELLLSQIGLRPNQFEQFEFVRGSGTLGLAVVLLLGSVSAPIAEELFFRGVLFGLLKRRQPLVLAYLVSGGLFAAAHLVPARMTPAQMAGLAIGIFVLGTLLAWTYERTGSLYPGMLAHALNNATGLILLYAVQAR